MRNKNKHFQQTIINMLRSQRENNQDNCWLVDIINKHYETLPATLSFQYQVQLLLPLIFNSVTQPPAQLMFVNLMDSILYHPFLKRSIHYLNFPFLKSKFIEQSWIENKTRQYSIELVKKLMDLAGGIVEEKER